MPQQKNNRGKKRVNGKQRKAYKPRQKKNFQMKRQPFVETKKKVDLIYDDSVMNPLTLATNPQLRTFRNVQMSPISTYMFMTRGHNDGQIVGRDIYSKYLKQKLEITLPQGRLPDTSIPIGNTNRVYNRITRPCQIWVVWGWVKKPFGDRDDPSGQDNTIQDVYNEIDRITNNGIGLMGNPDSRDTHGTEYTTFSSKRPQIWTMNKKLLRLKHSPVSVKVPDSTITNQYWESDGNGNPRDVTGSPTNPMADFGDFSAGQGFPNKLQASITWKTSRKVRYNFEDSQNSTEGFARDEWLPYSYLVIPKEYQDSVKTASDSVYSYETAPNSGLFNVYVDLVNDCKLTSSACHWYSDS